MDARGGSSLAVGTQRVELELCRVGTQATGLATEAARHPLRVDTQGLDTGQHQHSRGLGADDMLVTKAGLWIASDNEGHSQTCGFVSGLSGICFLPYG